MGNKTATGAAASRAAIVRRSLASTQVQIGCMNSSAALRERMETLGYNTSCPPGPNGANPCADGGPGFKKLVGDFVVRAQTLAKAHGFSSVGNWQEVFDHYGEGAATPTPPIDGLDPNTVLYAWLAPAWGWGNPATMAAAGFRVVSTLGLYPRPRRNLLRNPVRPLPPPRNIHFPTTAPPRLALGISTSWPRRRGDQPRRNPAGTSPVPKTTRTGRATTRRCTLLPPPRLTRLTPDFTT